MRNLKTLSLTLLIISLAITSAYAKRNGWGGPFDHEGKDMARLEQLKNKLDLTELQEKDIEVILTENKEQMKSLREETRTNKEVIRDLTEADTLNELRLRELLRAQSERHADMIVINHATRSKINQVLTPEQQEQRDELRQDNKGKRRSGKCSEPRCAKAGMGE